MFPVILKTVPAAVMLFWAVRIFLKPDVRSSQLLMSLGMLLSVMTLFAGRETALFMFPFFFLSIHDMTSGNGIPKWYWLVLLPSIILIPFRETLFFSVFLIVQMVILSVWSIVMVRRYVSQLSDYFDNGDDMSEDLNQTVIYLVATVVVIIVMLILPDSVISVTWIAVIFSLFVAVLQFLMGKTVYDMKEMPSNISIDIPAVSVNADDKLLQRIISEKLYLNPMLSLVSLADELHTNRTYLSNSIHTCYNQNFSDFINTLRIRYALELMKAGGNDVNIKDVALSSGYNHIQSFYRNFAQIMEMTPKTWLSRQLQENK